MPSLLDKIAILKTVSIFSETPENVLAEVAELLEHIEIKAEEIIFKKGDMGNSMYIIVEGRVRVHDEDMLLNFLEPRAVFGEMAALDPEPRSASVTAVEDTRLFRLEQHPFYALMERRPEVVQGVIHVLCHHLRDRMRDLREDFSYIQQVARITATAAAVESGLFETDSLNGVAQRPDELGQLARVFQRMIREVYAREQRLRKQLEDLLRIEIDQTKQKQQVAEITESDFFQNLQRKAKVFRQNQKIRRDFVPIKQPDFESAKQYALDRLARELSPALSYHSLAHTQDEVLPAAERLAEMESIDAESMLLLRTAALFHDIGFVEQYHDNESIGVRIASDILPQFGYTSAQVEIISGIILATRVPQTPHTLLEAILADADLDVLGRDDFLERNNALRAELDYFSTPSTDDQWYRSQLSFLYSHRYFTAAAKASRTPKKQQNVDLLVQLLQEAEGEE